MTIWRGNLYGSSHGSVFRYEGGTTWTSIGKNPFNANQIHKIQVYNGQLIAGTWPYGTVMRYEGEVKWSRMGDLGIATDKYQINEINDLRVYNGKLYAGVIPLAEVYRNESQTKWTLLRRMVNNAYWSEADDHSWWRVPAMTVFQGKLFHGTSTCHGNADPMQPAEAGRIYSMEAGKNVSYDDDLGAGWKHLVAVRERNFLKLYINGKAVATSARFDGEDYSLSNRADLLIGRGANNNFAGILDDVRVYGGALSADQVAELFRKAGE